MSIKARSPKCTCVLVPVYLCTRMFFFFLWEGGRFVWKVPPKKLEGVLEGKLEDLPIILEGLPIIGRSSNILPVVLPYIYKAISPHNYKVTFPYIHAAIVPCIYKVILPYIQKANLP